MGRSSKRKSDVRGKPGTHCTCYCGVSTAGKVRKARQRTPRPCRCARTRARSRCSAGIRATSGTTTQMQRSASLFLPPTPLLCSPRRQHDALRLVDRHRGELEQGARLYGGRPAPAHHGAERLALVGNQGGGALAQVLRHVRFDAACANVGAAGIRQLLRQRAHELVLQRALYEAEVLRLIDLLFVPSDDVRVNYRFHSDFSDPSAFNIFVIVQVEKVGEFEVRETFTPRAPSTRVPRSTCSSPRLARGRHAKRHTRVVSPAPPPLDCQRERVVRRRGELQQGVRRRGGHAALAHHGAQPVAARRCLRGEQRSGGRGHRCWKEAKLGWDASNGLSERGGVTCLQLGWSRLPGAGETAAVVLGEVGLGSPLDNVHSRRTGPQLVVCPVRTSPSAGEVGLDLRVSLGLRGALRGALEASHSQLLAG